MSVWSTYESRFASGDPDMDQKWNTAQDRVQGRIRRKSIASPSYRRVRFNGTDMRMAIIDTADDLSTKKIFSMPGETLPHGSVIEWEDSFWLITEVNASGIPYMEGKMRRCNYYLKWINTRGKIIGRWCVVEDGTKFLTGEHEETVMTAGDARMTVIIGKDAETSQINRGHRFLIDDMDSKNVIAFEVTKPNKLYNVFNGKGVFRFIMTENDLIDSDNVELRIANYYDWMPPVEPAKPDLKTEKPFGEIVDHAKEKNDRKPTDIQRRKVWL